MERQFEILGNRIADFLPGLLGAIIVLLVGWLIAKGLKALTVKLLTKTGWDERVFKGETIKDTNEFLGNIVYYIIMIIVIMIALEILGINQVLVPLQNMVNEFLMFIPNLIAAILIGFIGYLLAKFVSNLVEMAGSFIDKWAQETGYHDTARLVRILKSIVFIVILIPFIIQALNALQLEAISAPANNLLASFFDMIGNILVAGIVVFLFIWGGKFMANFLADLLRGLGLDSAAEKIQIENMIGANQSLSRLIANILYFFLVFVGVITAVEILGLMRLSEVLGDVLEISGQILFGLVILGVGNYISLLIYSTMTKGRDNQFIAGVARWASLGLFSAIALQTMGIANEIVELAFGLTLGAIAVAVALSYGLGGREAAGEHFKDIVKRFRSDADNMSSSAGSKIISPPESNSPSTRTSPGSPLDPNRPSPLGDDKPDLV
ncbi:mechanosensitive ion channel [Telluribacter humicola]|uniref:mechanosensitive ion channel n=1 Tax=Telluribacter humicola TaxID=1720261 RepID=UPI001A967060|nr:mechanosensitive ion channel [Telluribacter humicola]